MKTPGPFDKHFVGQLTTVSLLTVLPIAMIWMNGSAALSAILWREPDVSRPTDGKGEIAVQPAETITSDADEKPPVVFGVYDPAHEFDGESSLAIRHIYLSWTSFDEERLAAEIGSIRENGHRLLLTIEPWPRTGAEATLFEEIVAGSYDSNIDRVSQLLKNVEQPMVSWGHEMDQDMVERYPWSGKNPQDYIRAYRYVHNRLTEQLGKKLTWVWAGVMKEGTEQYWPGNDFADVVGMPIYSYPEWDRKAYGYIRSFRQTFEEKSLIAGAFQSPLMITELGVHGSPDFEQYWLHQAFQDLPSLSKLNAVVFFYAEDTEGAWGKDTATPDWRVHPDAIRSLVQWHLK